MFILWLCFGIYTALITNQGTIVLHTAILLTLVITCIMDVKISSRIYLHSDMVELYHFLVKHLVTLLWWYNCVHKFLACVGPMRDSEEWVLGGCYVVGEFVSMSVQY